MKKMPSQNCSFSDAFYGSSTIGERGQIVIPAEARADLGYLPGDKVLVMRHPIHEGLVLVKIEKVREFIDDFTTTLNAFEEKEKQGEAN